MKMRKVIIFFCFHFLLPVAKCQLDYDYMDEGEGVQIIEEKSDGEYQRELEKKVLMNGASKPLKDGKVRVDYIPSHMPYFSLDEKQQMFYASYTICLTWTDERMKWDPQKYSGISYMSVGPSEIWRPKLLVVGSGSGALDITDYRPDRIKIRQYAGVQLLTCPTYFIKVGCALDLSNYPHDEQFCSFTLKLTEEDVELGSPYFLPGNAEMFAITINDNEVVNRTTTGSFSLTGMYVLTNAAEDSNPSIVVTVTFNRNAPYYHTTVTLPSVIFALLNISGSLIIEKSYAGSVFLLNILLIGIFMQDMIEVLPLHYEKLPNQVVFWTIHLLLAIVGFIYLLIKEVLRKQKKDPIIIYKIPRNLDEWTTSYAFRQIFSMPFVFTVITIFSIVMFFC